MTNKERAKQICKGYALLRRCDIEDAFAAALDEKDAEAKEKERKAYNAGIDDAGGSPNEHIQEAST